MGNTQVAAAVFAALCAVAVGDALVCYPQLPDQVAIHFGPGGQPNGWARKSHFLVIHLGTVLFTAANFLGIALLLPKLPDSLINLPNKEFWLAPERRQEMFALLATRLLWLGSATLALFLVIFHQACKVNLGQAARLEHAGLAVGSYLTFTLAWCIALYLRFGKVG